MAALREVNVAASWRGNTAAPEEGDVGEGCGGTWWRYEGATWLPTSEKHGRLKRGQRGCSRKGKHGCLAMGQHGYS